MRSHPSVVHPKTLLKEKSSTFNNNMVIKHAQVLGSVGFIWFAYVLDFVLFLVLCQQTYSDIKSHVPNALETLVTLWVVYIAQTYVQFVALPILQNFQNRQTAADEAKADVDHVAFTHMAQVTDNNEAKLETIIDRLNIDTIGGIKELKDELVDEIRRNSGHAVPQ